MAKPALQPIFIDKLLENPSVFRRLIENHAPYYPVQRYFNSQAEYTASSADGPMIIAPNFRGDWANLKALVSGAELFLDNTILADAAGELMGSDLVDPYLVFTNITYQIPFDQGAGHTDVPVFRGIERDKYPLWLLQTMGHSGLFEEERIRIATAVAWFYKGEDGGFEYWPDGIDAPSKIHEGNIYNTAVMGDNDRMFHRVKPVGVPEEGFPAGMTLDSTLENMGDGNWCIKEKGETLAECTYEQLRISVSYKAKVFRSQQEREIYESHQDDLTLNDVLCRFSDDLNERGKALPDMLNKHLSDEELVKLLTSTYLITPSA